MIGRGEGTNISIVDVGTFVVPFRVSYSFKPKSLIKSKIFAIFPKEGSFLSLHP